MMQKRLVRKAFDMILGISLSENKDVSKYIPSFYAKMVSGTYKHVHYFLDRK